MEKVFSTTAFYIVYTLFLLFEILVAQIVFTNMKRKIGINEVGAFYISMIVMFFFGLFLLFIFSLVFELFV